MAEPAPPNRPGTAGATDPPADTSSAGTTEPPGTSRMAPPGAATHTSSIPTRSDTEHPAARPGLPAIPRDGAADAPGGPPHTGARGAPGTPRPAAGSGTTRPASPPRPSGSSPAQLGADDDDTVPDQGPATPTSDDLVATGISGLDAQFGGGMPNGNLVVVTSEPTTATGTFAAQYAAAGLEADETVFFVSLERPTNEIEASIARFVSDASKMSRLHVIDGFPLQFRDMTGDAKKRLGMSSGEEPLDALEEILVDDDLKPPVRFVIESYTELANFYDRERLLRNLRLLRAMLRRLPATAIVMAVTPLHEAREMAELRHIADGVVEFALERKGFGLYPYISVTKMRGVAGSTRLLIYKETDTGLWIESTKRVF